MARYQAVRGTFDVLPDQVSAWQHAEQTARDLAHRFGFREIRTPMFELAELYTRGMGVMSGLIEKELWTFQDKFGAKLALRTDVTAGVVRAFQEHKLFESQLPLKVFYVAPVFLLGQEGEEGSRQSHQFGFEAIGSDSPALDAEVISLASSFCEKVGLEGHSIHLNSLGGQDCRPAYESKLKEYFGANSDQLCSTCKRKYKTHPDWVLSCESEGCKGLSQVAPTIYGMLSNGAKSHFAQLREYLEDMELPVELDPRVVRDSEYYNRTVFEIRCQGKSIGFGGRCDSLVEKLGGKNTPAVGFALSLETIVEILKDQKTELESSAPVVFFQPEGPESAKLLVPLLNTLRQRGVAAELDYRSGGRRPQAAPKGCQFAVILDESNAFRGNAIIRDLDSNKDEKVPVQRLKNRIIHVAGVGTDTETDGAQSGRKRLRRGRRRPDEEKSTKRDSKSSRDGRNQSRSRDENSGNEGSRDDKRGRSKRGRGRGGDSAQDNGVQESPRRASRKSNEAATSSRKRTPKRERAEKVEDTGMALMPVFSLGGAPSAATEPTKAKAKAKAKSKAKSKSKKAKSTKKKAAKKKVASASRTIKPDSTPNAASKALGGGLNWSILPAPAPLRGGDKFQSGDRHYG